MDDLHQLERLQNFIVRHIPGANSSISVKRIGGGQSNPTFYVTSGSQRLVLRQQPSGALVKTAHAVDREYRIMKALAGTQVPVPEVLVYSEDRAIVGTPFYLMRRIEGRVFPTADIPGVSAEDRSAMYYSAAETLARLHSVDWLKHDLSDFGREGNYIRRQLSRWSKQWELSKVREIPAIDKLIRWLPLNIQRDEKTTISHWDFRVGNLMFDPEKPRVIAVLDWELSTLGDPLADLGFFCIAYHTDSSEYGGIRDLNHPMMGIPSQENLIRHYFAELGTSNSLSPFYIAFALFRLAVIFVGIEARAAQGNAIDSNASSIGQLSAVFANRACEVAGLS
jgi:aminoglycoside phosphotransferase (APT) family kinase protein